MPRSCGVTVPSVSWPMIGKPFSARSTCIASVPYGVMPNGSPAAITASHIAWPCQPATFSSYASSPLKLTRAIRAGMPATVPSRNVMNGNASADRSTSVPSAASTSRARGPFIAIVAHCSVTLVQYDAEVRPLGLQPLLEVVEHLRGAAGRRRHEEPVVGEAHHDAVVEHHAVHAAHQAVADRPDAERRHPVRVHPVQERRGVGPDHVDLAERRRVHHADAGRAPPALRGGPPSPSTRTRRTGKYHGRFHWPTFSNAAPRSTCHAWIGVTRAGSNR